MLSCVTVVCIVELLLNAFNWLRSPVDRVSYICQAWQCRWSLLNRLNLASGYRPQLLSGQIGHIFGTSEGQQKLIIIVLPYTMLNGLKIRVRVSVRNVVSGTSRINQVSFLVIN